MSIYELSQVELSWLDIHAYSAPDLAGCLSLVPLLLPRAYQLQDTRDGRSGPSDRGGPEF
jgi:hypothetical protein